MGKDAVSAWVDDCQCPLCGENRAQRSASTAYMPKMFFNCDECGRCAVSIETVTDLRQLKLSNDERRGIVARLGQVNKELRRDEWVELRVVDGDVRMGETPIGGPAAPAKESGLRA